MAQLRAVGTITHHRPLPRSPRALPYFHMVPTLQVAAYLTRPTAAGVLTISPSPDRAVKEVVLVALN